VLCFTANPRSDRYRKPLLQRKKVREGDTLDIIGPLSHTQPSFDPAHMAHAVGGHPIHWHVDPTIEQEISHYNVRDFLYHTFLIFKCSPDLENT